MEQVQEPISIEQLKERATFNKSKRGRPRKAPTQEQIDALEQSTMMLRNFALARDRHEKAVMAAIERLNQFWSDNLRDDYLPLDRQWRAWLRDYTPDEILEAVAAAASAYHCGGCGYGGRSLLPAIKYIWKVLQYRRESRDDAY